jgi:hypothetical protein
MDGQKETAGPSTSLRSGRDDKFVAEEGIVIPTGGIMGLRQGHEIADNCGSDHPL